MVLEGFHPQLTSTDLLTTSKASSTINSTKAISTKQQVILHVEALTWKKEREREAETVIQTIRNQS